MPKLRLLAPLFAAPALFACPAQMTSGAKTAPVPLAKVASAGSCAEASLALAPDTVVARVDGQPVTAGDLGPALSDAESAALREYCTSVSRLRKRALEDHVNEKLVTRAAKAEGTSVDEYMRAKVDAVMATEPSEEEVQAFYGARAGADAPPLEAVRPQVVAAIQRERATTAIQGTLTSLRAAAAVEERLPDVRPPALRVDVPAHTATAGAEDPVVEVVEFADFECPYCSIAASNLDKLKQEFAGKRVRFAFRHFPLSFHPNARRAAEFTQCAQDQGRFWALHDRIFANPKAMDEASLRAYAKDVGLDAQAFEACLASGKAGAQVDEDLQRAQELGVDGTPTFFVNGRKVDEPTPEAIGAAIRAELLGS